MTFIRRDIESRYRGSVLGVVWSLLLPLAMLVLFTFIFSTVMQVRWSGRASHDTASFAELVFCGMIVFTVFSDVVSRAPTIVLGSANLVTKVAFPVEILPAAAIGGALFHAGISVVALLAVKLIAGSPIHWTMLLLPLVLAPLALMVLGVAYLLSAIGVFLRDTGQMIQPAVMALMFASPLFYPMSALPEPYRSAFEFNPLVWPMESFRALSIYGELPDLTAWTLYASAALLIAALGLHAFQRMRPGFADVL
ncbi:MAG: ABC transporter permease [Hyphomonas sp.]|nr:ABC transporter permease [Hyphomonas sp.]